MLDPDRIAQHEAAAHEKRNWIRLTAQCNNRCTFCLDSGAHNGTNVPPLEVKAQIIDGRRKRGATRLILSGGEPTIHPQYVEFIALGRRLGYRRIQTVTNGRMFAYPDFLKRCLDAGLDEITFSLHGPNARIHDALVGVQGAFDEEVAGLTAALADGRPIVNIDIVINRANVKHLTAMLDRFIALGVREFDLLQVIPFGRAYDEGRDGPGALFYDLDEAQPYLQAAFAYARRPDLHIWLNRFPPPYMEGYEALIQDPHKLHDEVRGRREEFAAKLAHGTPLSCEAKDRCPKCYLEGLCGTLDVTLERLRRPEAGLYRATATTPPPPLPVDAVWIVAADVEGAAAIARRLPGRGLHLECDDYTGLTADRFPGKTLERAVARTATALDQLLALPGELPIVVPLNPITVARLLAAAPPPARLILTLDHHERVTAQHATAVDLPAFFAAFDAAAAVVEEIPTCLSGQPNRPRPLTLDGAMLGPDGRLDLFAYTGRYVLDHGRTKSRRCRACVHDATCSGVHINFVRAHGYAPLVPIAGPT